MKQHEFTERQAAFDPVAVGQQECAAWAAYYRHDWMTFLKSAIGMVRAGFGMSRSHTLLGAWYVLQANRAWAPFPDNDSAAARDYMERFYRLVSESGWGDLDPPRAAALEVEWWRLHRAHQHGGADTDELIDAVDALYSHVYGVPRATMRTAARLRVEAMDLSDQWVRAGRELTDPLLAQERLALVASFTALRDSVERHRPESPSGGTARPTRSRYRRNRWRTARSARWRYRTGRGPARRQSRSGST
jgi:hypothetical protein